MSKQFKIIKIFVAVIVIASFHLVYINHQAKSELKPLTLKKRPTNGHLSSYYNNLRPTVVGISAKTSTGNYYGTGTVISPDGYVLTSITVIPAGNIQRIEVFLKGFKTKTARVILTDKTRELSLIKLDNCSKMIHATFANSDDADIGDRVFTAGNPHNTIRINDKAVLSAGIISSRYTANQKTYHENRVVLPVYSGIMFEITAASNGGGDGGGVFDDKGQIIGLLSLNTEKISGLGLCIPINIIKQGLNDGLRNKSSCRDLLTLVNAPQSTAQLITENPERIVLLKRANEYRNCTVALNIKRTRRKSGGDKSPNPYTDTKNNATWNIPKGNFTGTFVSEDGYVLTSYFAISGSVTEITALTPSGEELNCLVAGYNQYLDIALLKTKHHTKDWVDFSSSPPLKQGNFICLLASACNGNEMSFTIGKISASNRYHGTAYQFDAKCNMSSNGGILIDLKGKACGIACHVDGKSMWSSNSGVAFACNSKTITEHLENLKNGQKIKAGKKPRIGIRPISFSQDGVQVEVVSGFAASKAGLLDDDIIISIDTQPVKRIEDISRLLYFKNIGDIIKLQIKREDRVLDVDVILGKSTK